MTRLSIQDTFISVLSNTDLWGAIISTIFVISIGYLLVKIKVFKSSWKNVLNSVVLKVALPALAFTGFMQACTIKQLTEYGIILGVAFGFYIVLIVIAEIWIRFFPKLLPKIVQKANQNNSFENVKENILVKISNSTQSTEDTTKRALVMWMMLIFGSTTFFGMPIIKELYKEPGTISANLWNIPYRIFLYSYCFLVMSGLSFNKQNIAKSCKTAFLNPIVIATFLGLILWLTQLIPGASSFDKNFTPGTKGWFEWKVTMPYLHKPISTLGGLSSPLVWLSIGMTLATASLISAVKDKWVWIFSIEKLILIPLLVFAVMVGLVANGDVSKEVAISMVILAATPPATVAVAYSMQYKLCEKFSAQCSALCTLLAIIMIPLWIIISEATFQVI